MKELDCFHFGEKKGWSLQTRMKITHNLDKYMPFIQNMDDFFKKITITEIFYITNLALSLK